MSDRVQDLTNHRKVAVACKNYTDKEVKKAKDELMTFFSRNTVETDDHTNELAYQITAPSGAKLLQLQAIGGNTVKLSPSVASDSTKAMIKTMPATVYDFDSSKFYGDSVKYNQFVPESAINDAVFGMTFTRELNTHKYTISGTAPQTAGRKILGASNTKGHKMLLAIRNPSKEEGTTLIRIYFDLTYINSITIDNNTSSQIITLPANNDLELIASFNNAQIYNTTFNLEVYDLTAIFGAGNEPSDVATAKTSLLALGVNVDTNNPYSLGEIHNIELSGLKVEGSNLANPSLFELGSISTTSGSIGQDVPNNSRMRSNYIEVKPNTEYTLNYDNYNVNYFQYDEEYRCISNAVGGTFTTGATTKYVRFYGGVIDENTKVLFNEGTNSTYIPYVSQSISIDLSTILYNGSPLFTNGLCGVNNVKDEITPYKAIKRVKTILVDENTTISWSSSGFNALTISTNPVGTINSPCIYIGNSNVAGCITDTTGKVYITFINAYSDYATMRSAINGMTIIYPLATPIEVSIDWSATLRNIQGYSNGSIIAENTHNMEVESVITYNSIIQETLCPSITITRNGVEVETRNLPTITSDGYGVNTDVHNLRVFSDYEGNAVNKRYTNVDKDYLGNFNWSYSDSQHYFSSDSLSSVIKKPSSNANVANIISTNYTTTSANAMLLTDKNIAIQTNGTVGVNNTLYTVSSIFKTAMANEPLYYELNDTSKTETDMDDFDFFFDVEEGDVITFNNTYAQQVYATYSFIIEGEKSNE